MLDLKKLIEGSVDSVPFETSVEANDISSDIVSGGASARGMVTNHSGFVVLEGTVFPSLTVLCARCGKQFGYEEQIPLYAKITESVANDSAEDEFIIMRDFAVDIEELVRSTLVLELPMRFLCREDCKGLCPKCGADLNCGDCGCDLREHDKRWDALLDYFD